MDFIPRETPEGQRGAMWSAERPGLAELGQGKYTDTSTEVLRLRRVLWTMATSKIFLE